LVAVALAVLVGFWVRRGPDSPQASMMSSVATGFAGASAPAFTVVSAYRGLSDFVAATKADPSADREVLYRRLAIEPFRDDCRADVGTFEIARYSEHPDTLAVRLERLRRADVEAMARSALQRSHELLPSPAMSVCINLVHPTPATRYMHGVAGAAIGGSRIMLLIDAAEEYPWSRIAHFVVAHEYHHEVATSQFGSTSLDGASIMMYEGRADAFASRAYPRSRGPWTVPLDSAEQVAFFGMVTPFLASRDTRSFYRRFMFGRQEGVPYWAGYRAGFAIVEDFLRRHPDLSVSEWTALPPEVIIANHRSN
jgi:hypothetical protein